jgi:hypothetical protein
MPSKTTTSKAGPKGTRVARHPPRCNAGKPIAQAAWFVGKKVAKRKARRHARRYGEMGRTAGSALLIYGPMAAEVLGVVEPPKPRRRLPVLLTGIVLGAAVAFLLGRNQGA